MKKNSMKKCKNLQKFINFYNFRIYEIELSLQSCVFRRPHFARIKNFSNIFIFSISNRNLIKISGRFSRPHLQKINSKNEKKN